VQAGKLLEQVLITYMQNARMLMNHLTDDKMETRDEFRDMKMWKNLNNREVPNVLAGSPNPFVRPKERTFKQTSSLDEAMELLPDIIDAIVERSGDDPALLRQNLDRLKSNSYQSMPSPKRSPEDFAEYMDFLTRTQGEDAAGGRFQKYQEQNEFNRMKSKMVP
jgi:hypothetical protein